MYVYLCTHRVAIKGMEAKELTRRHAKFHTQAAITPVVATEGCSVKFEPPIYSQVWPATHWATLTGVWPPVQKLLPFSFTWRE